MTLESWFAFDIVETGLIETHSNNNAEYFLIAILK